jgi:ABC-type branched-subunit amino acid transport system ATPase component
MTQLLELHDLSKRFGRIVACDRVRLTFEPGSCTAVIGPNGAGKSTIMNMVAGAVEPDAGRIVWGGRELVGLAPDAVARLGVSRMFQDLKVFPSMTVLENLISGLLVGKGWLKGVSRAAVDEPLVQEVLQWIGLRAHADRRCRDLSYAERKLVALGRTICASGELVLLDEPASGLDGASLRIVLDIIGWLKQRERTLIVVEHNLSIIEQIATRAILLEEGRIIADGTPRDLFTRTDFGRIYFSLAS